MIGTFIIKFVGYGAALFFATLFLAATFVFFSPLTPATSFVRCLVLIAASAAASIAFAAATSWLLARLDR